MRKKRKLKYFRERKDAIVRGLAAATMIRTSGDSCCGHPLRQCKINNVGMKCSGRVDGNDM